MRTPALAPALVMIAFLGAACSRPNPGWIDDGATSGAASTSDASASAMSLSTSLSTSSGDTSSTGAGSGSSDGSSGVTTDALPECGPLDGAFIQIDGVNDQKLCEAGVELYGEITNDGVNPPLLEICLKAQCGNCTGLVVELQPEAGWILDGSCLTLIHEGVWAPGDPEAPGGCKTTGVLLFLDNDLKYPVYAASSRVFKPPLNLEPAFTFTVEPTNKVACTCTIDGCCGAEDADRYDLLFGGELTLAAGVAATFVVGDVIYVVEVLRGHRRTYDAEDACYGPVDFVDWQMVRLSP